MPGPSPLGLHTPAESDVVIGAGLVAVRCGDRRRPGRRCESAETGYPRHDQENAVGQCRCRHRHRPGRLLRDQPADHALRTDLCRRSCRALLRRQHPRRSRPHRHLCTLVSCFQDHLCGSQRHSKGGPTVRAGKQPFGPKAKIIDMPHAIEALPPRPRSATNAGRSRRFTTPAARPRLLVDHRGARRPCPGCPHLGAGPPAGAPHQPRSAPQPRPVARRGPPPHARRYHDRWSSVWTLVRHTPLNTARLQSLEQALADTTNSLSA